jgi:hypothetical protein|tara:strand:- start:110 stop:469 length:360 start_codon:yes stop_codon:yes gene_type:complete
MKTIIFSISILVAVVLGSYLAISGFNKIKTSLPTNDSNPNKSSIYKNLTPENVTLPNFITPEPVKTGYVQNSNQDPADDCRPKGSALYPIKQPYVDYDKWKGGDCCKQTCDVIKFNEPP